MPTEKLNLCLHGLGSDQPKTSIKEHPILFTTPMVQAILEGRKTQTRRVLKLHRGCSWYQALGGESQGWWEDSAHPQGWWHVSEMRCPKGQPGDRLWVREAFQPTFAPSVQHGDANWKTGAGYAISYPATDGVKEWMDGDDNITTRCKPSIHMPRWASRILLEIISVRVERLQDISEADTIAEGVTKEGQISGGLYVANNPRGAYFRLWEDINGHGSWAANPWVWAVEFKRIENSA